MALKTYRPYTPSRRFMTGYDFSDITATKPYKPLTKPLVSTAWRNNAGRITTRRRWGGHKKRYRVIDFRRYDKQNIPATVETIEYDPNRTCRIVLLSYADGEKRYALAWKGVSVGDVVMTGDQSQLKPGNSRQLKDIPDGFSIYALEVTPRSKGKLIRSAGMSGTITGRDEEKGLVYVRMGSSEVRMYRQECRATIGVIGNEEHKNISIGKAWRMRRKGRRPVVLGKSMNPVDHPHGWGEGHTGIALRYPKAFNGRPVSPGKKTRSSKKRSTKFIAQKRKTRFK